MKTASKLISAAFALAAIASTALPMAQPAEAASPPDLEAKILATHRGSGGSVFVEARITDVGGTTSAMTTMSKGCGYLPPANENSILLEWGVVDALPATRTLVPALNPSQVAPNTNFTCPLRNGQVPVAVRITASASQGETNLDNNKAGVWGYKLFQ